MLRPRKVCPPEHFYQHLACCLPHQSSPGNWTMCQPPTSLYVSHLSPLSNILPMRSCSRAYSYSKWLFNPFGPDAFVYFNHEPIKTKPNPRYGTETSAVLQKNAVAVLSQSKSTFPPNPSLAPQRKKEERRESKMSSLFTSALGRYCFLENPSPGTWHHEPSAASLFWLQGHTCQANICGLPGFTVRGGGEYVFRKIFFREEHHLQREHLIGFAPQTPTHLSLPYYSRALAPKISLRDGITSSSDGG